MTEVRRSLVAYLAAAVACALILVFTFELWRADLHIPLNYELDSISVQLWAKGVVENGWYLSNPSLGAPFGMEMHDFPLSDSLFFLLERAISLGVRDPAVVVNLYYFGTFFATTLVALFVLRRLGAPRGPSIVCGLLYAFLPYHFLRGEGHLFLSSYFLVPLAVLVCLWLYRDGELLFKEREGTRARLDLRGKRGLGALGICAVLGSGGVYYAAFACALLLVAGASAAIARRRVHPLGSAAILAALIAGGVAANLVPKLAYEREHGPNPEAVLREPGHVEVYALKLTQLLLPSHGHRVGALARLRDRYDRTQATPPHENGSASLGVIGGLGFLALVGGLFRRKRSESPGLVDGLVTLNLAAFLLATTGGFGAVFGFAVSPLIRCYNRMSIFLAFFALAAVALGLARLVRSARPGAQRLAVHFGLAALLVAGVLDQTTPGFVPKYEEVKRQFAGEAEFVGRVESALPPGSMVFQLPLLEFPEASSPGKMGTYDHARAYLHSRSLRWSFGAMKGRYGDSWQKHAADLPVPEMLRALALAGFSGVYVDRAGYADGGAAVEAGLAEAGGARPIEGAGGRLAFFDLTPYAAALRRDLGPDRWAAEFESALRPMVVTWRGGFYGREEGAGVTWHWSGGSGEIRIANPSGRPRRVELSMGLATAEQRPARVWVEGPGVATEWPADSSQRLELTVPPDGATLRFRSDARAVINGNDPRALAFRVERFRVEESGGPGAIATSAGADRR